MCISPMLIEKCYRIGRHTELKLATVEYYLKTALSNNGISTRESKTTSTWVGCVRKMRPCWARLPNKLNKRSARRCFIISQHKVRLLAAIGQQDGAASGVPAKRGDFFGRLAAREASAEVPATRTTLIMSRVMLRTQECFFSHSALKLRQSHYLWQCYLSRCSFTLYGFLHFWYLMFSCNCFTSCITDLFTSNYRV